MLALPLALVRRTNWAARVPPRITVCAEIAPAFVLARTATPARLPVPVPDKETTRAVISKSPGTSWETKCRPSELPVVERLPLPVRLKRSLPPAPAPSLTELVLAEATVPMFCAVHGSVIGCGPSSSRISTVAAPGVPGVYPAPGAIVRTMVSFPSSRLSSIRLTLRVAVGEPSAKVIRLPGWV